MATADSAVSPAATLTIRHQPAARHSWSLDAGPYRLEQTVRLREGQSVRVVNHDTHVHRLVKLSGGSLGHAAEKELQSRRPASAAMPLPVEPGDAILSVSHVGVMNSSGASVIVTFHEAGGYLLTTAAGAAFTGAELASSGRENTLIARVLVFRAVHHPLP